MPSRGERENLEVKVNFAKSRRMVISKMQILTLGETRDNCRLDRRLREKSGQ